MKRFSVPLKKRLAIAAYSKRYYAQWKDDPIYREYKKLMVHRWRWQKRIKRLERALAEAREKHVAVTLEYARAQRRFRARRAGR